MKESKGSDWIAETTQNGKGGRLIEMLDAGNTSNNVIQLGHEAYRDGYKSNNQYKETIDAVIGHTALAERMREVGLDFTMEGLLGAEMEAYRRGDMNAFIANALTNYDSSGDYWKVTKDGNLEFDGRASLTDENGNVIKSWKEMELSSDNAIEGGLLAILGIKVTDTRNVQAVREMMENSGLAHSFGVNSDNWYWRGEQRVITGNSGSLPMIGSLDLTTANMGKNISLGAISTLFATMSADNNQYNAFINNTYGSAIGFMNYADTNNQSIANSMLANVYDEYKLGMIRTNQTWYNSVLANGQNIRSSMLNNNAQQTQGFGDISDLLKLSDPSQAAILGALFLKEVHPALDFGKAQSGAMVNTPGGYWEFLDKNNHRASFELFGGDLRMRIMHINPIDINQTKGSIYGSTTESVPLFSYPTSSFGGGTGPHIHVEMTRNLPSNGVYTRQYVNPNTLLLGNQLNYPMNYYNADKEFMGTINYNRKFPNW